MADPIDFTFLARLVEQSIAETRVLRTEMRELRTVALATAEGMRRIDRRMAEMRDDLELMIRTELMGRTSLMENVAESREHELKEELLRTIDSLKERIKALEKA